MIDDILELALTKKYSIGKLGSIIADLVKKEPIRITDLFELLLKQEEDFVTEIVADAIEKASAYHIDLIQKYKNKIIEKLNTTKYISVKWHMIQIMGRLKYNAEEAKKVGTILKLIFLNETSSIVKVSALQAVVDLSKTYESLAGTAKKMVISAEKSNIKSLQARSRKLKNNLLY